MAVPSDRPLIRARINQRDAIVARKKPEALAIETTIAAMPLERDPDALHWAQSNAWRVQDAGWNVSEFPTLASSGAWQGSPAYAQEMALRQQQGAKIEARDLAGAVALEAQLQTLLAGRPPNVSGARATGSRLTTSKLGWTAAQFPTLAYVRILPPAAAVVSTWPDQPPAPSSSSTSTSIGTSTTGTVVSTWPDQIPVDAAGVPVNAAAAAALYAQLTGQASTTGSGDAVPAATADTPSPASRVLPWLLAAAGIAAAKFF